MPFPDTWHASRVVLAALDYKINAVSLLYYNWMKTRKKSNWQ